MELHGSKVTSVSIVTFTSYTVYYINYIVICFSTFFVLNFSAAARESGSSSTKDKGSEVMWADRGSLAMPPNRGSMIVSGFLVSLEDLDVFVSTIVWERRRDI